jgi:elongator complex protein 3
LKIDKFNASGGIEYFISYISEDEQVLYGFCRLRLTNDIENQMKEIHHCALIRELHVYSTLTPVNKDKGKSIQHRGFGKRLLKEAEKIAITHGYVKSCVISGVGVRNYYRKFGYELDTTYMIKKYNVFQFMIMYVYYNLMYYLNKK